ncbi:MAG TPA: glycosyl hydrolase family 65 protein, partial [Spirochaetia bacterium]|nr:glycosyl hydrolase family 65 protein [Spirochaetia bacterium]
MTPNEHSYPLDNWKIREIHFDPAMAGRNETIFALANGHLGMRGNFEEGFGNVTNGTYINGFFEESPIVYGETAFGYARNRQVMLNVADAKVIRLKVNGEAFDLTNGNLVAYQRTLDLAEGFLLREVRWVSPGGVLVEVTMRRIVSLVRRHIAAIEYVVAARGKDCSIEIESAINGNVMNQAGKDDPRIGTHLSGPALASLRCEASGLGGVVVQQTRVSQLALACAMSHTIAEPQAEAAEGRTVVDSRTDPEQSTAIVRFRRELKKGDSVALSKYIAYCTSKDFPIAELGERATGLVDEASRLGFGTLAAEQAEYVRRFWATADIEVDGDEAVQQGLRYNLFSMLQSAGRDGATSIAAKGLTGEGYEGHYFWDTEIYVLPFFIYSSPEIARSLLRYRCGILDKARTRAREMSQKGALFPWRTIGGEETSPYYPAGSAQYHINADIVFALKKYLNATLDDELLVRRGAELIFETARLWADLGDWLPTRGDERPAPPDRTIRGGSNSTTQGAADLHPSPSASPEPAAEAFYINEVTGPDEYTALVNNNTYTNQMAQFNLQTAFETARGLQRDAPAEYERISKAIGLNSDEVDGWERAARRMFFPYDRAKGISAQDDAFLQRARWDFKGTPRNKYPLLLHFHPLVIYRYQVLKQPDVVLAQFLRGDRFSMAEKKRNFDYYDQLTTGDSSLSPCIQSVAAVELGYTEQAYRYFMRTARMDLDDINGNVADGVHIAAMAGTWISLIYGFAGMRDYEGRLSFDPRLPKEWRHLLLKLHVGGGLLAVEITHERVSYQLTSRAAAVSDDALPGPTEPKEMTIVHRGREILLPLQEPVVVSLRPQLECIVFDLDGVITDTAEYHFQAWSRIAE